MNQSSRELSVTNFLRYFGRSLRDHIAQSACDLVARRAYCVGGSLKIMCVRPCVDDDVRLSVAIKNDQVLNGETSVSKVNGSKRDPKKIHLQDLIARFEMSMKSLELTVIEE